jgi:hypothetical protein
MITLKQLLVTVFLFFSNQGALYAHCYKVIHLKNNEGNDRFLFADYHVSKKIANWVNLIQKKEFLDYAQHLDAAVIVEDAHLYCKSAFDKDYTNYNNNDYCCLSPFLFLNSVRESFLHSLTAWCYYASIPVTNVEFRFDNYVQDQVLCRYERIKKEIESYNDGTIQTKIYQKILHQTEKDVAERKFILDHLLHSQPITSKIKDVILPFIPIISSLYRSNKVEIYYEFSLYGLSHLLDAQILHYLEHNKQRQTIFVAAGGWHIYNICSYLQQLGYKIVGEHGSNLEGSGFYPIEPNAVSFQKAFTQFGISYHPQSNKLISAMLTAKSKLDSLCLGQAREIQFSLLYYWLIHPIISTISYSAADNAPSGFQSTLYAMSSVSLYYLYRKLVNAVINIGLQRKDTIQKPSI